MLFKHFEMRRPSFKSLYVSHFLLFSFNLNVFIHAIRQSNKLLRLLAVVVVVVVVEEEEEEEEVELFSIIIS